MLLDIIKEDYNNALKQHEALKVSVLRMLVSDIKNKEIELRGNGATLTEQDMLNVLQKAVKTRTESAEIFQKAGRDDLYQAESAEIQVIVGYLPKQISDEEIDQVVSEVVKSAQTKEFGAIMKDCMTQLKGKADGKRVGDGVKKALS